MTLSAFVAFTIFRKHEGQIPVQQYVALVHVQTMCLRCVCVVLEALLAWLGVALFFFVVSGVCLFYSPGVLVTV